MNFGAQVDSGLRCVDAFADSTRVRKHSADMDTTFDVFAAADAGAP